MSLGPHVRWQITVLLVTALFAATATAATSTSCPRHFECEAVANCAAQHGGAGRLDAVLIFDCAEGRVCCPPLAKKAASLHIRRRHRKEETMKRRQQTWQLFDEYCGKLADQRVYSDGDKVKPGEHPWMALLSTMAPNDTRVFHCGGTLITERYVLTAAHCVVRHDNTLRDDLMVRLGEVDIRTDPDCKEPPSSKEESTTPPDIAYAEIDNDEYAEVTASVARSQCEEAAPKQDFAVVEVTAHERFSRINRKSLINDIALLRLDRRAHFTEYVTPVCLPWRQYDEMENMTKMDHFTIAGWGLHMDSKSMDMTSPVLKTGEVSLLPLPDCKLTLDRELTVTPKQTCTVPESGNACMGDSGGPLITLDRLKDSKVQLGIVSFSKVGACSAMFDDVVIYTKVFAYKNWILDNLRADP